MTKEIETEKEAPLIRKNIWDFLSLALVVFFPIAFLYFRNFTLVSPKEVLITFLVFFSGGFFILVAARLFTQRISKIAILLCVIMLAIMLFEPIETRLVRYFPFVYYWHLIYIFITLIVLLGVFIFKRVENQAISKINQGVAVIFGILVLTNIIMAIPQLIVEVQKKDVINDQVLVSQTATSTQENVYLFIFDEYGGQDGLLRYAEYDNSSFYDGLENLDFNVSPHSRNYTIGSNIEVANLLNLSLSLTSQNYTLSARNEILKSPALFTLFKQNGYSINVIDDQSFISPDPEKIDRLVVVQSNLSKVESFILATLRNTVFYPFFAAKENDRPKEIVTLFDEIKKSTDIQDKNLLTVGYFMFPHKPWVFDENGNELSISERENWRNPKIYLGQLKFVSSQILEVVKDIIRKDPNCIIVIQSDHGYRLPMHLESFLDKPIKDRELESDFQRNILNAVYFKGKELDINNLSGLNTLIKVINAHFSIAIPFVDSGK